MAQYRDTLNPYLERIREHYPDITLASARLLTTEGQFSDIVIVDEALVFRFPRSAHGATAMQREIPVLKALQGKLPLPIPITTYVANDPDTDALVFMGYPMLPGQPLTRDVFEAIQDEHSVQQVAEELTAFLKVLHALPLKLVTSEPEPRDARVFWRQLYAAIREQLFPRMRLDARAAVAETFETALNNPDLWQFEDVLCHGDFGAGNILYSEGHITGVIDFTTCGPGDPAQDVGALLASYGQGFIKRIFSIYPELSSTLPRVEFITSTYSLQQALYALDDDNQDDFDDGIRDYV